MRILYAAHGYKPAYRIGGPIISLSAVAERLADRGHKVVVVTTNSNLTEDLDIPIDRPANVDGVEVWYFRRVEYLQRWFPFVPYLSASIGFLYAPKMKAELDRMVPQVDLVHTHLPFIYPTYAAATAAYHHGRPYFYSQRGVLGRERLHYRALKKRIYTALIEKGLLERATTLVALNKDEVDSYKALGVQTTCRVVPNGVDVDAYWQKPVGLAESMWGIPKNGLVILYLGRLHVIKGVDKLIEAFLRISSQFPNAYLVIAGPDESGIGKSFQRSINQAGAAKRIVFPGMVSGEAKLDLLARADVFCLPSLGEGLSMAILEALASATPVVISPGCHFPEVESAGAGKVIPNSQEELASALSELIAQPEMLREMGRSGRCFVTEKYTWDRITDTLLDVYLEGIDRHRHYRAMGVSCSSDVRGKHRIH